MYETQTGKVTGNTINDKVGQSGVEADFDDDLRGISGQETVIRERDGEMTCTSLVSAQK